MAGPVASVRLAGYAPGLHIAAHEHELPSLCLTLGGSYVEHARARLRELEPGHVILCRAGEPHAQDIGGEGARKLIVTLSRSGLDHLEARAIEAEVPHAAGADFLGVGARLAAELKAPDPFSPLAVEGLALELLARFCRSRPQDLGPCQVRRVCELLAAEGGPRDLHGIAEAVGAEPGALASAFRKERGETIGEHLRAARLRDAAARLARTSEPIAAIAADCGFYDQAHLTRAFRRAFGTTPAALRRNLH